MLIIMKRLSIIFLLSSVFIHSYVFAGIQVSGTDILDGTGSRFIMRGVNHAHTWYRGETGAFADIAATGANTVRVVLANGTQWARNDGNDVANIINLCRENRLICVLEVHDSTGYPESSGASHMSQAADYWISSDIRTAIQGQEDYIIINIANEPFGNNVAESDYVNANIDAINTLRNAGLSHALMVDGSNWGQDWELFMRDNAAQIFAADPQENIIFDVHMYEVFANRSTQESYIDAFKQLNFALVIGEFGPSHNGITIDEDSILELAEQNDIGYLAWSWSGNGSCCVFLDLVNGFNANSLTSWGERLINGENGIRETSLMSPIFTETPTILPIANKQSLTTPYEQPLSITLSGSSSQASISAYQIVTGPMNGSLSGVGQNWVYTPNNGFANYDEFTFVVVDSFGQTSVPAAITILVEGDDGELPPAGGIECSVREDTWPTGYVANVTVTNTSNQAISSWSVLLNLDAGDVVQQAWGAILDGTSAQIAAINESWNGGLAPNQSTTFGFQGTHPNTNERTPISCQ